MKKYKFFDFDDCVYFLGEGEGEGAQVVFIVRCPFQFWAGVAEFEAVVVRGVFFSRRRRGVGRLTVSLCVPFCT